MRSNPHWLQHRSRLPSFHPSILTSNLDFDRGELQHKALFCFPQQSDIFIRPFHAYDSHRADLSRCAAGSRRLFISLDNGTTDREQNINSNSSIPLHPYEWFRQRRTRQPQSCPTAAQNCISLAVGAAAAVERCRTRRIPATGGRKTDHRTVSLSTY